MGKASRCHPGGRSPSVTINLQMWKLSPGRPSQASCGRNDRAGQNVMVSAAYSRWVTPRVHTSDA